MHFTPFLFVVSPDTCFLVLPMCLSCIVIQLFISEWWVSRRLFWLFLGFCLISLSFSEDFCLFFFLNFRFGFTEFSGALKILPVFLIALFFSVCVFFPISWSSAFFANCGVLLYTDVSFCFLAAAHLCTWFQFWIVKANSHFRFPLSAPNHPFAELVFFVNLLCLIIFLFVWYLRIWDFFQGYYVFWCFIVLAMRSFFHAFSSKFLLHRW